MDSCGKEPTQCLPRDDECMIRSRRNDEGAGSDTLDGQERQPLPCMRVHTSRKKMGPGPPL
eukprot:5844543-Karenia_brevis.AAC.1